MRTRALICFSMGDFLCFLVSENQMKVQPWRLKCCLTPNGKTLLHHSLKGGSCGVSERLLDKQIHGGLAALSGPTLKICEDFHLFLIQVSTKLFHNQHAALLLLLFPLCARRISVKQLLWLREMVHILKAFGATQIRADLFFHQTRWGDWVTSGT